MCFTKGKYGKLIIMEREAARHGSAATEALSEKGRRRRAACWLTHGVDTNESPLFPILLPIKTSEPYDDLVTLALVVYISLLPTYSYAGGTPTTECWLTWDDLDNKLPKYAHCPDSGIGGGISLTSSSAAWPVSRISKNKIQSFSDIVNAWRLRYWCVRL